MCGNSESCSIVCSVVAIIFAMVAIGLSGSTWWTSNNCQKNNTVDSASDSMTDKRLGILEKQLADLNNKSKMERAATSRTISFLTNETKELKVDYINLLSETKALNKTINFTTSATVQRVLDELRGIQKSLKALSHLNDTAADYLNLREEVKNLTTHVNQNINRLEGRVNENRREWQEALENKTSKIDQKISDLEKRLDRKEFENTQNKTNVTSDATGLRSGLLLFYTIICLTSLGPVAHSNS